jgi:hypothetical protein
MNKPYSGPVPTERAFDSLYESLDSPNRTPEERERFAQISRALHYRATAHKHAEYARRWQALAHVCLLLTIPAAGLGIAFGVLCLQAMTRHIGDGVTATTAVCLGMLAGICASVWTHGSLMTVTVVRRLLDNVVERFGRAWG